MKKETKVEQGCSSFSASEDARHCNAKQEATYIVQTDMRGALGLLRHSVPIACIIFFPFFVFTTHLHIQLPSTIGVVGQASKKGLRPACCRGILVDVLIYV